MIITKLSGGLGNQMFQYSIGRSLALKRKDKLFLDVSGYEHQNKADTKREYELSIFNIRDKFASEEQITRLKGKRGSFSERVLSARYSKLARAIFSFDSRYHLENADQKFENRILKIKLDAYLEGWWQSYKYFDDIKDILQKEFTFKKKLSPKNTLILKQITRSESLGVHVRLGDYVSKYKSYFVNQPPTYYRKAIKHVYSKRKIDKTYVFVEKGKRKLVEKLILKGVKFQVVEANPDHNWEWQELLELMKNCKHQIIANSSFSWWAAYLNPNPNKIVVAPKKWLVHQKFNISDRIPPSWIKI